MSTPTITNGQYVSETCRVWSVLERPGSHPGFSALDKGCFSLALSSQPEPKKSLWFSINNEGDIDNNTSSHLLSVPSAFCVSFLLPVTTL